MPYLRIEIYLHTQIYKWNVRGQLSCCLATMGTIMAHLINGTSTFETKRNLLFLFGGFVRRVEFTLSFNI